MKTIIDEFMKQMIWATKRYKAVLLKDGPNIGQPNIQSTIWGHGRRNFALREDGLLFVVCPVSKGSELHVIEIFNADVDQTKIITKGDPCIIAGIFINEIHATRSFLGDSLPQ